MLKTGHGRLTDRFNNAGQIRQNLIVRESKHKIALRCEPRVALLVIPLSRFEIVTFSVKLDHEPRRMAQKIGDISPHRYLASEPKAVHMVCFEITPQKRLSTRQPLPQSLCAASLSSTDGGVRHLSIPPSLTLPHKGGGNRPSEPRQRGLLQRRRANIQRSHQNGHPLCIRFIRTKNVMPSTASKPNSLRTPFLKPFRSLVESALPPRPIA